MCVCVCVCVKQREIQGIIQRTSHHTIAPQQSIRQTLTRARVNLNTTSCAWCTNNVPNQHCSACQKKVYYCGNECQRRHWPLHKLRGGKPDEINVKTKVLCAMCDKLDDRESRMPILGSLVPLWTSSLWSHCLEVRPSAVHERGVFATRHLPAGAAVTGFPAHTHSHTTIFCVKRRKNIFYTEFSAFTPNFLRLHRIFCVYTEFSAFTQNFLRFTQNFLRKRRIIFFENIFLDLAKFSKKSKNS